MGRTGGRGDKPPRLGPVSRAPRRLSHQAHGAHGTGQTSRALGHACSSVCRDPSTSPSGELGPWGPATVGWGAASQPLLHWGPHLPPGRAESTGGQSGSSEVASPLHVHPLLPTTPSLPVCAHWLSRSRPTGFILCARKSQGVSGAGSTTPRRGDKPAQQEPGLAGGHSMLPGLACKCIPAPRAPGHPF